MIAVLASHLRSQFHLHNRIKAFCARYSALGLKLGIANAVVLLEPKKLAEKLKTIAAGTAQVYKAITQN